MSLNKSGINKQRINDFYGSILHKDGTERLFHMSGAPNIDSDGNVTGVVGTFRDITELKKSELELWDSNRRLWKVIEERRIGGIQKSGARETTHTGTKDGSGRNTCRRHRS